MSAPERRPVFLSPHYDDAALSCGGTLAAMADAGDRPLILTVFGGEPTGPLNEFALNMHREWGLSPSDAISHRQNEDTHAAEILGAESHWLDLPDAIYRDDLYLCDDHLFGAVHPREATYYRDIRASIEAFFEEYGIEPNPLYCPMAAGNHVDHQLVLVTARTLTYRGQSVLAYEDYPYAGDPGVDVEAIATIRSGHEPVVMHLTEEHVDRRIRAIMCYASQHEVIFRFQGGDPAIATRAYAERVGCGTPIERFWPL
jgi:LmbE family N-acetylglucosaminyl deacetylase